MKLLIVESPNKIKKIKALLGGQWDVAASVGHIRDLPDKELGIDKANRYKLLYEVSSDKKSVVAGLKKKVAEVGKENVYLATDPDREGEAIAFHLCQALGLDHRTTKRVTFQEITAPAILAAVGQPRTVDMHLVAAQESRRAVDRLVGYEISPILWKKVESGLSAGRVQSVAVRLVVDREREIASFADRYTFGVFGTFQTPTGEPLKAKRAQGFADQASAEQYLMSTIGQRYTVRDVAKKPVERPPGPAYSTSTLQQDGVKKLKLSVKRVSELAQKLFEAGHITYIRTDSVNLSETAIAEAQAQITTQFGDSYFQKRTFKNKEGAQEAHEAIRPTHWDNQTAGDNDDEQRLYQLIYSKALASQMSPARFDETIITLASALPEDTYTTSTRIQTFDGYLRVYQEAEEEADDTGDEGGTLKQAVAAGDVLAVVQLEARQTFAKPPRRFDEATLVAELEKRQIGRPSTYAAILGTIQGRNYIATGNAEGKKVNGVILTLQGGTISRKAKTETIGGDKAKLLPTPKGTKLTEFLETNFAKVVDYKFTAGCEEVFDQIADGASTYADFVPVFDQKLAGWLQRVEEAYQDVAPADQRLLGELEGKPVTVGKGKFGTYVLHDEVHYSVDGLTPEAVTLAKALAVIAEKKAGALREVGTFQGKPVAVGKGKFGTYVAWEKQYFNAPAGREPADITATEAAQLITEGLAKKTGLSDELVATIGKYTIRQGEKGLYVTDGKDRAGLFKDVTREQAQAWTEDQCKDTINKFLAWKKKQK